MHTAAVLLGSCGWGVDASRVTLANDVALVSRADRVFRTVFHLRGGSKTPLDDHDGERDVAIVANQSAGEEGLSTARARIDRACDILSLLLQVPCAYRRVLCAPYIGSTFQTHDLVPWIDNSLRFGRPITSTLDARVAERAVRLFALSDALASTDGMSGRIATALRFFGRAWRAPDADQLVVNLAISLRALFAVPSINAASTELRQAIARFVEHTEFEQGVVFERLRRLFEVDAAILLDGRSSESTAVVGQAFPVACGALSKALMTGTTEVAPCKPASSQVPVLEASCTA